MRSRPAHYPGRYHLAGVTDRGPVGVCPRLTSMSEYVLHYGARTEASAVVYDDLALFFAEGGWEAYLTRVVGPAATRGELVLTDGTTDTLRVVFTEPGAHSGDHSLLIEHDGLTWEVWLVRGTTRIDHWAGLTNPTDFVTASAGHRLIAVTDLGAGVVPAAGSTPFSTGTDDAAGITPADYRAALDTTGGVARGGCVAAPALPIEDIGVELVDHASQFHKVALLCGSQDTTVEELAALTAPIAALSASDHAGVFWPWVTLNGPHRPRHQAPTGYVAAARARTITTTGYWRTPAGDRSTARTFSALRFPNTPATNEAISEQLISPIVVARQGVQLHGWWSLSEDRANFPYLLVRDLLNNIAVDLAAGYASAVNHTWDTLAKLSVHVRAVTKSVLGKLANAGALTPAWYEDGAMRDPGYVFQVTVPAEQPPDRNVVDVRVAVRPQRLPNLITVHVFRVDVRDPLLLEVTP